MPISIKYLQSVIPVDGQSQQFSFDAIQHTSTFRTQNFFTPTLSVPSQNILESKNNNNSGYRWVHNTTSTDNQGSFVLQSFTNGQTTGTPILTVGNDNSLNLNAPINISPTINVLGDTQSFIFDNQDNIFQLKNTFSPSVGNPSTNSLKFTNSSNNFYELTHSTSDSDSQGSFLLKAGSLIFLTASIIAGSSIIDFGNTKLSVPSPSLASHVANKDYVDTAIGNIAVPSLTLNGDISGSGLINSPITTTLNLTLNQIPLPTASVNFNNQNLINVSPPVNATDGVNRDYVDTHTWTSSDITDFSSSVVAFRLDQFALPTSSVSFNNQTITNLGEPQNSTDAATRGFVETAVSGIPTAFITLNGDISGSGLVTSPISTSLNLNLSQISLPTSNVDLNNKKIINLSNPTAAGDGTNKTYVDNKTWPTSAITNFTTSVLAFRLDQFSIPTSSVDLNSQRIINLGAPSLSTDGTNKAYVDGKTWTTSSITNFNTAVVAFRLDQFATPTSSINMGSQKIINLASPTLSTDAATKGYVDSFIAGAGTVTSVSATTTSAGLSISGSPITSTGTFTFTLNGQLQGLAQLTNTGIVVQTSSGSYASRSITAGSSGNITITNGNGISGNPIVELSSAIKIGNINISGNTITTNGALGDGNLYISPSGLATTFLYGYLNVYAVSGVAQFQINNSTNTNYCGFKTGSISSNIVWTLPTSDSAGFWKSDGSGNLSFGSAAPTTSKYIIQTSDSSLPNAQVLGSLSTGILKNTTTTGVLTVAVAGTDYYSPGNPTTIRDSGSNFFIGTSAGNTSLTGTSNTGVGRFCLNSNTTGSQNCGLGAFALTSNTTGSNNTAVGAFSMQLNTIGIQNTAFGSLTLSLNTNGNYNVAVGHQTLYNNTGSYNSGSGFQNLYLNTSGSTNTASGALALNQNTTGSGNTALGFSALFYNQTGGDNVAIGDLSMQNNVSSNFNTAVGSFSLQNITTGVQNTALGFNAGKTQTSYSVCTFLGAGADASVSGLTNAIAIGYNASVSANNSMVLGGSGTNQVSVGIGLTPNCQFQLATIHANRKIVLYETANNDYQVYGLGTSSGEFKFLVDSTSSDFAFYSGTSTTTSQQIVRFKGNLNSIFYGNVAIGGGNANAPLQFTNANVNRKCVLFDASNNDHQFIGTGTNAGVFRFQIDQSSSNYIFYAGSSSTTSTELCRLTGNGNLLFNTTSEVARVNVYGGVQNVTSEDSCIRAVSSSNAAKIELFNNSGGKLWELRSTSGAQFQITNRTNTATPLVCAVANDGSYITYTKQSCTHYYGQGSGTTTLGTAGNFSKINLPTTSSSTFGNNFTQATAPNKFTFVGQTSITALINISLTGTQSGANGEITTFAIYYNGFLICQMRVVLLNGGGMPINSIALNRILTLNQNDYIEIYAAHSVSSRTITITECNISISST